MSLEESSLVEALQANGPEIPGPMVLENVETITKSTTSSLPATVATLNSVPVPSGKRIIIKTVKKEEPDQDFGLEEQGVLGDLFQDVQLEQVIDVPVVDQEIPNNSLVIMSADQVWGLDSFNEDQNSLVAVDPRQAEGFEDANNNQDDPLLNDQDLLNMVLNDTVDPNSQEFQDFIKVDAEVDLGDLLGPSTSFAPIPDEVIKAEPEEEQVEPPAKRGRGRPRLPRPLNEAPRRPRGRPPTAATFANLSEYESSSNLSEEEVKVVKYKRMRELNNAASKRCRINRKRKQEDMESEVFNLAATNEEMRNQVKELEDEVAKYKQLIFGMIKKKKASPAPLPEAQPLASTSSQNNVLEDFDIDLFDQIGC